MKITNELRAWAAAWWRVHLSDDGTMSICSYETDDPTPTVEHIIIDMANRIDAMHEHEMTMARGEAIQYLESNASDEYIKLPVDADGVPIRIGDRVRIGYTEFEVIGFGNVTCDDETYGVFMQHESGEYEWFNARFLHHASDSWEHIIKDAVKLGYADYPTTSYEAELVERCRRLAGE